MLEEVGAKLIVQGEQAFLTSMSKAQKSISDTGNAAKNSDSQFSKFSTGAVALGVALGTALYNGAMAAGRAILNTGKEALDAYGFYERMGLSLDALVARELKYGSAVEKTTTSRRQATASEKARVKELQEMIDKETKAASKVDYMSDAYMKSEKAINKYKAEMQALGITQDGYIYSTQKATSYTLDMAGALELAGPRAQELLDWINQLAIISPFQAEDVATALRTAMAFGFTSKESQRLVTTFTDFTAATGATGDVMDRIMLSLGQIRTNGKLSAREVRELALAGVPIKEILGRAFHLTGEQLENLAEDGPPAAEAIEVIVKALEEDFGGAAKRQAGTWQGLLSSLSDIKRIGLKEFFTSTFKAVQPYLQKFVDLVQTPQFMAKLREWGEKLGSVVKSVLGLGETIGTVLGMIKRGAGITDIVQVLFGVGPAMKLEEFMKELDKFGKDASAALKPVMDVLSNVWSWLQEKVPTAIGETKKWWDETLVPALKTGKTWMDENLVPTFKTIQDWLGTKLTEATTTLTDKWNNDFKPALETVDTFVKGDLHTTLDEWSKQMGEELPGVLDTMKTKFYYGFYANLIEVRNYLNDYVVPIFTTLKDIVLLLLDMAITPVKNFLVENFTPAWEGLLSILGASPSSANSVNNAFSQLNSVVGGFSTGVGKTLLDFFNGPLKKALADILTFLTNIKNTLANLKVPGVPSGTGGTSTSGTGISGAAQSGNTNIVGGRGHAAGGMIPAYQPALVGERGMELFFPTRSGYILPNDLVRAIMGAQAAPSTVYNNTTINYNLGVTTSQSPQVVTRSFAQMQLLAG